LTSLQYEDLEYQARDGVATITLNRPAKLNALRMQTYEELAAALRAAGADETAGIVVVRGAGRAFCAGGDLEMAQTMLTSEHAGREHFFGRMIDCSNVALALGKPVVCAVQGACVGGGAEFTLFADLVIADASAFFVFNGTSLGGCSWWGGPQLLPLLVGLRRAEEILYLSKRVGAEEAAEIGLITQVVPAGELEAATDELCGRILNLSEQGMRLTKSGLRSTKEILLTTMSASAEIGAAALAKPDLHAAFDAFLAGRTVSWRDLRPDVASPLDRPTIATRATKGAKEDD
jgi:enoyl-CoA hydratase/carnithine racemase